MTEQMCLFDTKGRAIVTRTRSRKSCQVDGCPRVHYTDGYCCFHTYRKRNGIPFDRPKNQLSDQPTVCKIDDCGRKRRGRAGYCATHAYRLKHGLPLEKPIKAWGKYGDECSQEECPRRPHTNGLCTSHHNQMKTHGYTWHLPVRDYLSECGYSAAHWRAKTMWGSASDYPCVKCSDKAADWAYDGTDPDELFGLTSAGSGVHTAYSRYPEFYMPMCKKCHKNFDAARLGRLKAEFRLWRTEVHQK